MRVVLSLECLTCSLVHQEPTQQRLGKLVSANKAQEKRNLSRKEFGLVIFGDFASNKATFHHGFN